MRAARFLWPIPAVSNRIAISRSKFTQVTWFMLERNQKFEYEFGLRGEYTQVDTYLYNLWWANPATPILTFPKCTGDYINNQWNSRHQIHYSRRIIVQEPGD